MPTTYGRADYEQEATSNGVALARSYDLTLKQVKKSERLPPFFASIKS